MKEAVARTETPGRPGDISMVLVAVGVGMCQYCSYRYHDGWTTLLEYDDVYQDAVVGESQSTYGFHESWDDLRDEVGYGTD